MIKIVNVLDRLGALLIGAVLCMTAIPTHAQITFHAVGAQTTGTGSTITPAIPAGTLAGDLAILIVAGRPSNTTQPAAPSGWTLRSASLQEAGANDLKIMTFYRVLTGSNTNPNISVPSAWQGNSGGISAQIAVWRGVNATTPFDANDVVGNASAASTWTPPSITTVTTGALVISAVATSDDNSLSINAAQNFTGRITGTGYDTTTGGDHSVGLADKLQANSGTATMLTWIQSSNASDTWAGITFALRPATVANVPPTASITSPANGSAHAAPAWITVQGTVADSDGTITKVEWLQNGTVAGTDMPPVLSGCCSVSKLFTSLPVGSYTFAIRATDNSGAVTTSASINVTVVNNAPPTVSFSTPTNGATFTSAPSPLNLIVNAADSDGTIARVDFYKGVFINGSLNQTFLSSVTSSPYAASASGLTAGNYVFQARAFDNLGTETDANVSISIGNAPTVNITSPANGASFVPPANIPLTASATDSDGTITKVEFFQGATLISTVTSPPYVANASNLPAGSYSFTAQATDNHGLVKTSTPVAVIVSAAPTATILNPANGKRFAAPAQFELLGCAQDSDGNITTIDWLQGESIVFSQSPPIISGTCYVTLQRQISLPGTQTFKLRVTDNSGLVTTSAPISITVINNVNPTVNITSPANNAVFTAPANISFTATATDSDGTIDSVQFAQYNSQGQFQSYLAVLSNPPYVASASNLPAGNYMFSVRAFDDVGGSSSSSINITVTEPPAVSITNPINNAAFAAPANVPLTAVATGNGGTISKVEFFQDSTLISTVTSQPYVTNAGNLSMGSYSFTARATDSFDQMTTSAPITVIVGNAPTVSITSPASGTFFGSPANVPLTASATDSDGTITKVEFFQGATLISTVTSPPYVANASNLPAGSYSFTAQATDNHGLVKTSTPVAVVVDVPPTVSITTPANGATFSPPANIPLIATATSSNATIAKVEFFQGSTLVSTVTSPPYVASADNRPAGNYSFTARATDSNGLFITSASVAVIVNASPTISITSPENGAVFSAIPANIPLTASVLDNDGSITKVEFFQGATLIATVTSPPYVANANNLSAGNYSFSAWATDNLGTVTTSTPISIIVGNAPTVSITSPTNGAVFASPASIPLAATATDIDGTVAKVEFFQGSTLIATVMSPPYVANSSILSAGTYSFTARATDNQSVVISSSPVSVTVTHLAEVYFIHTDQLNTPRLIVNSVGQSVWAWNNDDPYGNNAPNENPSGAGTFTCNLRLPGQYFDQETNTHYNYFRDYDASTGRYVQSDPIGLRGGINTYSYAMQNPISNTDPNGLTAWNITWGVGGGVGYIVAGGSVYNLKFYDPIRGQGCSYTVYCVGLGVGLSEFGLTSPVTRWDDGQGDCSDCKGYSGIGSQGSASVIIGSGFSVGGWLSIPNGPTITGELVSKDGGAFRIGTSVNVCRFSLN